MSCIFCSIDKSNILLSNSKAFVIGDKYPQSRGHVLIIPFRHYENYFDSGKDELEAMNELIFKMKEQTDLKYSPKAYNININAGKESGQIIMHAHIHLIQRY